MQRALSRPQAINVVLLTCNVVTWLYACTRI
jgi:hypothetical protein